MTDAERVRALEQTAAHLREHLDVVDLARRNALEGEAEAWSAARRLRAENARLRVALQQVIDEHEMAVGVYDDQYGRDADCVAAARAALEEGRS